MGHNEVTISELVEFSDDFLELTDISTCEVLSISDRGYK